MKHMSFTMGRLYNIINYLLTILQISLPMR